ncbi:MAG: AAA family ATPase [Candidatus Sericytochromatia bacterium]
MSNLKLLLLGNSTFEKIIKEACFYIDKIKKIQKLIGDNKQSKYYFLARPKRFGKSFLK